MEQNIILLFGGESNERLVSVASAQAMAQALGEPKLWFWGKDNAVYQITQEDLLKHEQPFTKEFFPRTRPDFLSIAEAIASKNCLNHTFVLGLHGGKGEDGTVQALLEAQGRSYTGSDASSSKLAFDKLATKECLKHFNIKMPPHLVLKPETALRELEQFFAEHGEIIIKPICGGSSLGLSFIRNHDQLSKFNADSRMASAQNYFVEKVIRGRELTVGVIEGTRSPIGLPVTEIAIKDSHDFDYEGKYLGRGTSEHTPADISEIEALKAQRMAMAAHVALKLYGYSRTDMILANDGLYYLETNTLPGLTKQSLLPQQLAALHITLREFLATQIRLAQSRSS